MSSRFQGNTPRIQALKAQDLELAKYLESKKLHYQLLYERKNNCALRVLSCLVLSCLVFIYLAIQREEFRRGYIGLVVVGGGGGDGDGDGW